MWEFVFYHLVSLPFKIQKQDQPAKNKKQRDQTHFGKVDKFFILTAHKPLHLESKENDKNKQAAPADQKSSDEKANINSSPPAKTEQKTESHKQQTENMEVHKHPHHVTHKKKWGEYVLEFFMLFLAVFLGFVAENIRENVVEQHREKQYMQSLFGDVSGDTAAINYGLPRKEGKIKAIDTIFMFFNSNKNVDVITGKLFKTLRRTTWDQLIDRNTITISQLKNAGNMRLVKKKNVADAIAAYDMLWINIDAIYKDTYVAFNELSNRYSGRLVNPGDLLPLYINNTSDAIVNNIPDSLLIRIDTTELKQQLNFMMSQKVNIYQQLQLYSHLRESAEKLMELLNKEYHLE